MAESTLLLHFIFRPLASRIIALAGRFGFHGAWLLDGALVTIGHRCGALRGHDVFGRAGSLGILALHIRVRGSELAIDDRNLMGILQRMTSLIASLELDFTFCSERGYKILVKNFAVLVAVLNARHRALKLGRGDGRWV